MKLSLGARDQALTINLPLSAGKDILALHMPRPRQGQVRVDMSMPTVSCNTLVYQFRVAMFLHHTPVQLSRGVPRS